MGRRWVELGGDSYVLWQVIGDGMTPDLRLVTGDWEVERMSDEVVWIRIGTEKGVIPLLFDPLQKSYCRLEARIGSRDQENVGAVGPLTSEVWDQSA
jgi:hypothetical protein